jgi:hypothetical protein
MMKDLDAFATGKLGEEGVKIPLRDVEGNETEHWIKIKSTDSMSFKKAQSKFRRKLVSVHEEQESSDSIQALEATEKFSNELLASLVVDWSFHDDDGSKYPCNKANILKVFKDAPMLAQEIDTASAKRKNFIKGSLKK